VAFPVAFDADVLYGIQLTDFFLTMATKRMFRPYWSPLILEEVRRNLRKRLDLDDAAIDRRLEQMNIAIPDALVEPPRKLVRAMPSHHSYREHRGHGTTLHSPSQEAAGHRRGSQ
jgi:hypothetical protein